MVACTQVHTYSNRHAPKGYRMWAEGNKEKAKSRRGVFKECCACMGSKADSA